MMTENYLADIDAWKSKKEEVLKEEDGWLSIIGLHWLEEGSQSVGSSIDCDILLPKNLCAKIIGNLELVDGNVCFTTLDDSVLIDGNYSAAPTTLIPDILGNPSIVISGDISFLIIVRDDMVGIRVKQNSNQNRINFSGREWYPLNMEFLITGKYQLFEEPVTTLIPTIIGQSIKTEFQGEIVFDWCGKSYSLIGEPLDDGSFYIILNDASCKKETYPAGRFLVTEIMNEDNTVILDFNKAYNPPCAFSQFATCPLPPRENVLPFEIVAGEKYSRK